MNEAETRTDRFDTAPKKSLVRAAFTGKTQPP